MAETKKVIDWHAIGPVMLDMDGTLLDLHFDTHFWQEHLPRRFAQRHATPEHEARRYVAGRLKAAEGTLSWYCLEHWSRVFDLDVVALKHEIAHLVELRPQVGEFLRAVRASGRPLLLVTNAHAGVLHLKLERTDLARHFDAVVCSHDLGVAKEEPGFWQALAERHPFAACEALLIDDSLAVLRCARAAGFGHVLAVRCPDSRAAPRDTQEFDAVSDFGELMPVPARRPAGGETRDR